MIKDTNKTLNELLVDRMASVYSKKPWFGRSFNDLVKEIDLENIEIQRLIRHIIAWREYTIEIFKGGQPTIEMNTSEDWPEGIETRDDIVQRLKRTQGQLIDVVQAFDSKKWDEMVWHGEYSYYYLASGIIDHDIYHLGQMVLLHKKYRRTY